MTTRRYGAKYDEALSTTEIARRFRADVKAAIAAGDLPRGLKLSVRTRYSSGSSAIDVRVTRVPAGFRLDADPSAAFCSDRYASEALVLLGRLEALLAAYNFDGSRVEVDVFDVNFYAHVSFGVRPEPPGPMPARDPAKLAAPTGERPVRELVLRYSPERGPKGPPIDGPEALARLVRDLIDEPEETAVVLVVDAKGRVICRSTVGRGTLSSCAIHPREVMKRVIYANGSGVAFVHNHPSGDPTPSVEDRELTERLCQASAILGIRMLDHLVVAFEGWRSIVSGASGSWPTASEAA